MKQGVSVQIRKSRFVIVGVLGTTNAKTFVQIYFPLDQKVGLRSTGMDDYYDEDTRHQGYDHGQYCSRHSDVKVVSDCGRFDAPCGHCEMEMDTERYADDNPLDVTPVTSAEVVQDVFGDDDIPF